jgi:hypothetical protein
VGPAGVTGDETMGGSGAGPSTWLGQEIPAPLGIARRSMLRRAPPWSIPRGLAPQPAVPPG